MTSGIFQTSDYIFRKVWSTDFVFLFFIYSSNQIAGKTWNWYYEFLGLHVSIVVAHYVQANFVFLFQYRDIVRQFIKGTDGFSGAFAECLCGSPNLYQVSVSLPYTMNFWQPWYKSDDLAFIFNSQFMLDCQK